MKLRARKNWLWLWLLLAAFSGLLTFLARPTSSAVLWVELALIGAGSFVFGFALALKSFSTFRQRFWGGLLFSGGSLFLLSNVAFLGCTCGDAPAPKPTQDQLLQWEIDRKARVAPQIVPRDAQADPTMLDLTPFYDGWLAGQMSLRRSSLHTLEPGTHTWEGIKFDVRGLVLSQNQPERKIVGLTVGQKCSEIAFLHGANGNFENEHGNLFGRFVIHYANGHAVTVPIAVGKDVLGSKDAKAGDQNLAEMNSVVWSELDSPHGTVRPTLVFYITKWKNPFPRETVATIDCIPSSKYANSFLVAVTIRPFNS